MMAKRRVTYIHILTFLPEALLCTRKPSFSTIPVIFSIYVMMIRIRITLMVVVWVMVNLLMMAKVVVNDNCDCNDM